ncbi:MAG: hypothetical protein ACRD0M_13545, partial [Acidimicrobiales bacterium]
MVAGLVALVAAAPAPAGAIREQPVPVLAYYDISIDAGAWDRAGADLPRLGRYSSDDDSVVRRHIVMARSAGIGGFLVGWSNTPVLNPRLERLIEAAEDEQFKLGLVYQGPLPVTRAAADLDVFAASYAASTAFQLFDKPLVVVAGSWERSPEDLAALVAPRRDRLLVLASERSAEEYRRLGRAVDGNALYRPSADPSDGPGYQQGLDELGG